MYRKSLVHSHYHSNLRIILYVHVSADEQLIINCVHINPKISCRYVYLSYAPVVRVGIVSTLTKKSMECLCPLLRPQVGGSSKLGPELYFTKLHRKITTNSKFRYSQLKLMEKPILTSKSIVLLFIYVVLTPNWISDKF